MLVMIWNLLYAAVVCWDRPENLSEKIWKGIWIAVFCVVSGRYWPTDQLWLWFAICVLLERAFFQDWRWLYFERKWLVVGSGTLLFSLFLPPVPLDHRIQAIGLAILCSVAALKRKMGWADIWCLIFMGWILGHQRLLVCLLFACLIGLIWAVASCRKQEKCIPFISCLCISFVMCLCKGYFVYCFIINL